MKLVYVIVGELDDGTIDTISCVCHSPEQADVLCLQAETEDPSHNYTWHAIPEVKET